MKNFAKIICALGLLIVAGGFLYAWAAPNKWDAYFDAKLQEPPRQFIKDALQMLPAAHGKIYAIDLGAGVGHETLLLLQKGYHVVAVDNQKIAFDYMLKRPEITPYKDHLITKVTAFEGFDFNELPNIDVVVASFSLPFCKKENFDAFWLSLVAKIPSGGYFIGNTFDPGFTAFRDKDREHMTFHAREQTLKLFDDFKIISFKEVKKPANEPGKFDHYYEVIAQKS
jgi:tellurite methyltransferase